MGKWTTETIRGWLNDLACVFCPTEGNTENITFGIVLYYRHGGLELCNHFSPFFDEFQFKSARGIAVPAALAAAYFFLFSAGFVKLVVLYPFSPLSFVPAHSFRND